MKDTLFSSYHTTANLLIVFQCCRYQHGIGGVKQCTETAAQYAQLAANVAAFEYHRVGGQPILEADRIDDKTAREVREWILKGVFLST